MFISHLDEGVMWHMMVEEILLIHQAYHGRAVTEINRPFVETKELWKVRNVETSVHHLVGMVDWGVDLNLEVGGHWYLERVPDPCDFEYHPMVGRQVL